MRRTSENTLPRERVAIFMRAPEYGERSLTASSFVSYQRLRISTVELLHIRKIIGAGWKFTDLSNRVLNCRAGRFIKITAAHSVTRITRQSRFS